MKDTGIIRRIDDLGRIVIPKEIRRSGRIRENDPMEIWTVEDGILLKKHSPMHSIGDNASLCVQAMYEYFGVTAIICDFDTVLAASCDLEEKRGLSISEQLINQVRSGKEYLQLDANGAYSPFAYDESYSVHMAIPVYSGEEVCGAVVVVNKKPADFSIKTELSCAGMCAALLTGHLE